MKCTIKLLALVAAIALAGCTQPVEKHRKMFPLTSHVKEYRTRHTGGGTGGSDTWIYTYVMLSSINNGPATMYYYSSPTQIMNFSTTQFVKAPGGKLPPEVEEEVNEGEAVADGDLPPEQEPADVEADEGVEPATATESESGTTTESSPSTESSSTESSPTSTDSGSTSSDSGGGGGDSGGGGSSD